MDTKTKVSTVAERADRDLWMIEAELDDLREAAKEWEETSIHERLRHASDWDHMMFDYLTELEDGACSALLAPEQCARYSALRENLREAEPLLERLNFTTPSQALTIHQSGVNALEMVK